MKENTQTAQTSFVCFDSATLDTGERRTCVISVIFCRNENHFFSSPSSFRPPHVLWGCPCESQTQTNKYAVIVCPHPCIMTTQAAGEASPRFHSSGSRACLLQGDEASTLRWPYDFQFTGMHMAIIMAITSHWLDMKYWFQMLVCVVIAKHLSQRLACTLIFCNLLFSGCQRF